MRLIQSIVLSTAFLVGVSLSIRTAYADEKSRVFLEKDCIDFFTQSVHPSPEADESRTVVSQDKGVLRYERTVVVEERKDEPTEIYVQIHHCSAVPSGSSSH